MTAIEHNLITGDQVELAAPGVADVAGKTQDAPDGLVAKMRVKAAEYEAETVELVAPIPGKWPGQLVGRFRRMSPEAAKRFREAVKRSGKGDQAATQDAYTLLASALAVSEFDGEVVDDGPAGGMGPRIAAALELPADTTPADLLRAVMLDDDIACSILAAEVSKWLSNPRPVDLTGGDDDGPFGGQ